MTWVLVAGLALLVFAFLIFVLKLPRGVWEAVAAALVLGGGGYALQGSPEQPGAPTAPAEPVSVDPRTLVEARLKLTNKGIPPNDKWVVIADGLARNGHYADAAEVLRGAVEADPHNSDAWLAMANALLAHSSGMVTPASLYAYRQAAKADPSNPGPPFFLGLALLQSGRVAETRTLWAGLLARAPEDAPWRLPLAQQLQRLDAAISAQAGSGSDSAVTQP